MNVGRLVRGPAYVILLVAMMAYLSDFVVAVLPPRMSVAQWRFGAVGTLSNSAVAPLLLALLAYVVAVASSDRTVLRVISVLSAFAAFFMILALGSFVLDSLEMRSRLTPGQTMRFVAVSGQVVAKLLLETFGSVVLARGSWRAAQSLRRAVAPERPAPSMLVPSVKTTKGADTVEATRA